MSDYAFLPLVQHLKPEDIDAYFACAKKEFAEPLERENNGAISLGELAWATTSVYFYDESYKYIFEAIDDRYCHLFVALDQLSELAMELYADAEKKAEFMVEPFVPNFEYSLAYEYRERRFLSEEAVARLRKIEERFVPLLDEPPLIGMYSVVKDKNFYALKQVREAMLSIKLQLFTHYRERQFVSVKERLAWNMLCLI